MATIRTASAAVSRARSTRTLRDQRVALYRQLGVKRLVREDGEVTWYGCTKDTERCFPAARSVPAHVLSGRETPPCCLRHVLKTLRRTLQALAAAGARCWLQRTTLLGAYVRNGLLPWAESAEVGLHSGDVGMVPWLRLAGDRGGVTDEDGFRWERATGGRYYRVAYSTSNRIYVNIFPFIPRNGTMKRDGWFVDGHKEFPEHFLHPMSSIKLSGITCPAPNNVREFLDIQFGANVIDNHEKLGYKILYPQ